MQGPYEGNAMKRHLQRGMRPVTRTLSASRRAPRGAGLRRGALCSSSSRRQGPEEVQPSAQASEVARLQTNLF